WKETNNTRTYFFYTDEGLSSEHRADGTAIQRYGYAPDSTWTTNPLYTHTSTGYAFYLNDYLGTPQRLIQNNGATVWSAKQTAFGKTTIEQETFRNPLRFAGQYFDEETGLRYNYFRDYNPATGRYIQSDPIGLWGGLNTYAYASANPTRFSDSRGLNPAAGAIAGGAFGGPFGAVAGGIIGFGIGLIVADALVDDSAVEDEECPDDEKDCTKASKYQLGKAGILGPEYTDEHDFKSAWGATPNSLFDICACKDGSIVIRAQGQCGISGPTIPTDARWK
ncbi:MAG: RHS repeat-associated core domain-containing protein, partial [Gammaproteobacteria bacterium]